MNNLREVFERGNIFKDESKLFPEYIPQHLPHREEQIKLLSSYLINLISPYNYGFYKVICIGPVGTGKTATVKYFGKILEEEAKKAGTKLFYIHVNCYIERTFFLIINKVLRYFIPQIPKRGFSTSEYFPYLLEYLESENLKLILTLDEFDYILRKSNEDKEERENLYRLLRYPELNIGKNRISLILILRNHTSIYNLEESILSVLQKNIIIFEPYTSAQLFSILEERVEEAFMPNAVSKQILEMIVKKVGIDYNGKGDARYALEILWKAGKVAELRKDNKILPEDVRIAFSETSPMLNLEILNSLKKHEKLLLLAIARTLKKSGSAYAEINKVKEQYKLVCEEYNEKPRKSVQVWEYLQNLKKLDLINYEIKNIKRGRRGYISSDIPISIIEKELKYVE